MIIEFGREMTDKESSDLQIQKGLLTQHLSTVLCLPGAGHVVMGCNFNKGDLGWILVRTALTMMIDKHQNRFLE